jgi:hypothetical protein
MKPPRSQEPRRVESLARVTVAEAERTDPGPLIQVATDPAVPEGTVEFRGDNGETVGRITNLTNSEAPSLGDVQSDPDGVALFQAPAESRPYHPMDSAYRDGTLLEARAADGSEFMMVWRRTSRYNAAKMRWEPVGFWSSHLSREPVKAEPVGWRLCEGFAMPGAVVT